MYIIKILTDKQKQELYLDFFNNFLTIEKFAEYYGLNWFCALDIIESGKDAHEKLVQEFQDKNKKKVRV